VLDEMSVQDDIVIRKRGSDYILSGFAEGVSVGQGVKLASHALQFMFLGNSGFRFPFMHVPTTGAGAAALYILIWTAVDILVPMQRQTATKLKKTVYS
jgi:hypothetical protein